MPKFQMGVTLSPDDVNLTARMGGAVSGSPGVQATPMSQNDQGKFVKMAGDSRYDMCAVGDKIEAVAVTVQDPDKGTYDGYTLGGILQEGRVIATAEGSEAAGTGSIAIGDYVVCGTPVAKGTALTAAPKVRKATNQPTVAPVSADNTVGNVNAAIAKALDAALNARYAWRVVAILSGTGAVGDKVLIERD